MTRGPIVVRSLWDRSHAYRVRIAMLAVGIFVLDTVTVNDIVIPVLYVNVVLLAMRHGRVSDVVAAGTGSVALTTVSFVFTTKSGQLLTTAVFNSGLAVLAIVCVTLLCLKNIRSQAEVLRSRGEMARVSRGIFLKTVSASVVHEVTQPLTAIGANAEAARRWLSQSPPNLDETAAATRRIVAEVERASSVITRLRRLTAQGAISAQTCNLRALIEEALDHLSQETREASVDVTVLCPHDLAIVADRILIEQVVMNCVANSLAAMRAIEPLERAIIIEAKALAGRTRISLRDSGVGADEAALAQMFDPFFTKKVGEGMGIGLAVCRSIVDAHGGSIGARPDTPRGLVIEIELPVAGSRHA